MGSTSSWWLVRGNLWTGEAKKSAAGFFVDERADEQQRAALQTIFAGQAGGWPATFATLVETDVRGLEFVPIDFELADDLAHWRVEVPGRLRGSAEAVTGPTSPEGGASRFTTPPARRSPLAKSPPGAPLPPTRSTPSASNGTGPAARASTSPSTGRGQTKPDRADWRLALLRSHQSDRLASLTRGALLVS